jgi:alkanesulfonate monooxygenase SsuD/methylene tetrahydromethanopterin reductase-like flavin-dependent oxidoreductase (luciferase family)
MRFGLSVPPFCSPVDVVLLAQQAEAAGWDGFFLWDHLRFDTRLRLDVHNPWVLLGAIAAATTTLTLGPLVTPLARRRPWQVAKEVTTLDHLSGGRAVLGVGVGDPSEGDFGDFGDPATHRERAAVLDEALVLLDALLRGGPVEHRGERFSVTTELSPAPVQRPRPPIWVAAVAPHGKPLRRARRWDGIAPLGPAGFLTPDDLSAYLGGDVPAGWDVLAHAAPGIPAGEYAAVGATWLIDSTWPVTEDWMSELRARVLAGPRS